MGCGTRRLLCALSVSPANHLAIEENGRDVWRIGLTHTLELEDFLGNAAGVRACDCEAGRLRLVDSKGMKNWKLMNSGTARVVKLANREHAVVVREGGITDEQSRETLSRSAELRNQFERSVCRSGLPERAQCQGQDMSGSRRGSSRPTFDVPEGL